MELYFGCGVSQLPQCARATEMQLCCAGSPHATQFSLTYDSPNTVLPVLQVKYLRGHLRSFFHNHKTTAKFYRSNGFGERDDVILGSRIR